MTRGVNEAGALKGMSCVLEVEDDPSFLFVENLIIQVADILSIC
jgi:hypothetical protein